MLAERSLCEEAHEHLEAYLNLMVSEWNAGRVQKRSEKIDAELDGLRAILERMSLSMGSLGFSCSPHSPALRGHATSA